MSLSLYDISIPTFIKFLNSLTELLKKGERHADQQGIPHSDFLEARLAPDMLPFSFQVRASTMFARQAAIKLGGVEEVEIKLDKPTFEELHKVIQKTLEMLNKIDRAKLDASGDSPCTVTNPFGEFSFSGRTLILNYSLPNFYFHVTTTYALLRHLGVPIGKGDYFNMPLTLKS